MPLEKHYYTIAKIFMNSYTYIVVRFLLLFVFYILRVSVLYSTNVLA